MEVVARGVRRYTRRSDSRPSERSLGRLIRARAAGGRSSENGAIWPSQERFKERRTMKLTIERAALLKGLAHIQSVVERRNTIPILANVLIDAGKEKVALTATDMDLAIVETVAGQVAKAGTTT